MCRLAVYVTVITNTNEIWKLNTTHFDSFSRVASNAFGQRLVSVVVILVALDCGVLDCGLLDIENCT
jgi:hypothetical protein